MQTILALAFLERNGTLAGSLVIAAAFRFMPAGAFDDPCSALAAYFLCTGLCLKKELSKSPFYTREHKHYFLLRFPIDSEIFSCGILI